MPADLPRQRLSRKYLVALLLFVAYAVALFVHNLSVQQRLEQNVLDGASLELARQAETLSAYFSERHNSLANLAASDALANYFAGRDLGMSIEYGLGLHIQNIEDRFNQLIEQERLGGGQRCQHGGLGVVVGHRRALLRALRVGQGIGRLRRCRRAMVEVARFGVNISRPIREVGIRPLSFAEYR